MEAGLWPQENDTEFGFRKVIFAKEQKGHIFTFIHIQSHPLCQWDLLFSFFLLFNQVERSPKAYSSNSVVLMLLQFLLHATEIFLWQHPCCSAALLPQLHRSLLLLGTTRTHNKTSSCVTSCSTATRGSETE